ncbi:MAG: RNA-guided pseudouridylation complex pseudouridine synthase subunit Cbf5, partial [Methanomassiliicoccus sp.]
VDAICHGANLAMPGIISLDDSLRKGDVVAVMSLSGESVALGRTLMDSSEMMMRAEGFGVDISRVFMATGTYTKSWGTSKE